MLQSMGLQRVRLNLATEQQQFVKKTFLSPIELTQCLGQKLIVKICLGLGKRQARLLFISDWGS